MFYPKSVELLLSSHLFSLVPHPFLSSSYSFVAPTQLALLFMDARVGFYVLHDSEGLSSFLQDLFRMKSFIIQVGHCTFIHTFIILKIFWIPARICTI